MYVKLALALFLLAGVGACRSKEAFEYSQQLVQIERSMSADIEKTNTQFNQLMAAAKYDSAMLVCQRMESIAAGKLKAAEQLQAPAVKEAEPFKKSFLDFFRYIRELYAGYASLAQHAKTDRQREEQKLKKLLSEGDMVIAKMVKAQQQFAEANGFKIEPVNKPR